MRFVVVLVLMTVAGVVRAEPLPTELVLDTEHTPVGGIPMRLEKGMIADGATARGVWRGQRYMLAIEVRLGCVPLQVIDSVHAHGSEDARIVDGTHVIDGEPNPKFERARLVFATTLALAAEHRVAVIYGFAQVAKEDARVEASWAKVFGRIVGTANVAPASDAPTIETSTCEAAMPGHLAWRNADGWCVVDFDVGIGPLRFPDQTRVIAGPLDGERTAWIAWRAGGELVADAGRELPDGHSVHAVCHARTEAGLTALRARAAPPLRRPAD